MIGLDIQPDLRALRRVRRASDRERRIVRTELTRTARWAAGRAARAIAAAHQLPLRALTRGRMGRAGRVRVRAAGDDMVARLWIGTEPIPAGYAGRARQTRAGAVVRKHKFPGAFVATMDSGHRSIWRRAADAEAIRPGGRKPGGKRHLRSLGYWTALPIEEQTIELPLADTAITHISAAAQDRLRREVARRLRAGRQR